MWNAQIYQSKGRHKSKQIMGSSGKTLGHPTFTQLTVPFDKTQGRGKNGSSQSQYAREHGKKEKLSQRMSDVLVLILPLSCDLGLNGLVYKRRS